MSAFSWDSIDALWDQLDRADVALGDRIARLAASRRLQPVLLCADWLCDKVCQAAELVFHLLEWAELLGGVLCLAGFVLSLLSAAARFVGLL